MVETQLLARDIADPDVLRAMRSVPRHLMVPEEVREHSYDDGPLPIGWDQTISQPYIVAIMTQLAEVAPGERVLEIGTGSGYQAAVLAELGAAVYTIEIVGALAERAQRDLEALGYGGRVQFRTGDGYRGWPEHAPFDAVLVTAAPPEIPQPLLDQLAPGGRLVAPVGDDLQVLVVVERDAGGTLSRREIAPVQFVPMTGEAQHPSPAP
ncbi:MAG: protein-L-isoaspartate(D-aspartate) O-methyltransferase [Deltaproteobacteria bacterium]|nr:protein-L-isoaspartate(D-aspartate) O-methyltransferase [Deltaproteobacteria bacterium]